jgi:hypothetical protein
VPSISDSYDVDRWFPNEEVLQGYIKVSGSSQQSSGYQGNGYGSSHQNHQSSHSNYEETIPQGGNQRPFGKEVHVKSFTVTSWAPELSTACRRVISNDYFDEYEYYQPTYHGIKPIIGH